MLLRRFPFFLSSRPSPASATATRTRRWGRAARCALRRCGNEFRGSFGGQCLCGPHLPNVLTHTLARPAHTHARTLPGTRATEHRRTVTTRPTPSALGLARPHTHTNTHRNVHTRTHTSTHTRAPARTFRRRLYMYGLSSRNFNFSLLCLEALQTPQAWSGFGGHGWLLAGVHGQHGAFG